MLSVQIAMNLNVLFVSITLNSGMLSLVDILFILCLIYCYWIYNYLCN
jgi:hypothetical protein